MSAQLTLREAYETHYDTSELSVRAKQSFESALRHWEQRTDNPKIDAITDELLAAFRQACLDAGLSPATINGRWGHIRAVLRRCGPQFTGNPRGLGLIDRVPWMRLVKRQHKRPYRIPLSDLSRFYVACKFANYPRVGVHPADWWRCLLTVAYVTGLRRSDLFAIRFSDIDLEAGTLDVAPQKTGKCDLFHLHAAAVEHIKRIVGPRECLFRGAYNRGGAFDKKLHAIMRRADIKRPFTLHDIRRTAASEIDRVERGLGKVFLQHAPRGVSEVSYLNAAEELGDAIDKMRLPDGFRAGVKMSERADVKAAVERVEIRADEFHAPIGPIPHDWRFAPGKVWFRGRWFKFGGNRARILRLLVNSETIGIADVAGIIFPEGCDIDAERVRSRCHVEIAHVRGRVRGALGLAEDWDPVVCVERGQGGRWTLHMPPWLTFSANATLGASQLRSARQRAGWSQWELARMMRVSKAAVTKWEASTYPVPEEQAERLRAILAPYLSCRTPLARAVDHMTPKKLRTARTAAGLSRKELARRIDVSADCVRHWENADNLIPPHQAGKLAHVLFPDMVETKGGAA